MFDPAFPGNHKQNQIGSAFRLYMCFPRRCARQDRQHPASPARNAASLCQLRAGARSPPLREDGFPNCISQRKTPGAVSRKAYLSSGRRIPFSSLIRYYLIPYHHMRYHPDCQFRGSNVPFFPVGRISAKRRRHPRVLPAADCRNREKTSSKIRKED